MTTERPLNLPDFSQPPLNEVVLGVQFAPPATYKSILAAEIWRLFNSEFPKVEEHPPLDPVFETFGLPTDTLGSLNINLATGPLHSRYWFVAPSSEELVQFQKDRLLHNWRKIGDNEYPRFEKMLPRFQEELRALEAFFISIRSSPLMINQCEVSYINHILPNRERGLELEGWLTTLNPTSDMEGFVANYRRVLTAEGRPVARLHGEVSIRHRVPNREKILMLSFTVRGAPRAPSIDEATKFLEFARENIIQEFIRLTTKEAQEAWGRTQ